MIPLPVNTSCYINDNLRQIYSSSHIKLDSYVRKPTHLGRNHWICWAAASNACLEAHWRNHFTQGFKDSICQSSSIYIVSKWTNHLVLYFYLTGFLKIKNQLLLTLKIVSLLIGFTKTVGWTKRLSLTKTLHIYMTTYYLALARAPQRTVDKKM